MSGSAGTPTYFLNEDLLKGEKNLPKAKVQLAVLNRLLGEFRKVLNRVASTTGTIATIGTVTHDQLLELTDDDHPQYLRADGTRNLTGNLAASGGVTIDGVDVGTHRHSGGAGDGLPVDAIREDGGPTTLAIAAIANGQYLVRSGATVVGVTVGAGATATFHDELTPTGTQNGINDTFTLPASPSPAKSLLLTFNGQVLASAGVDFTLTGASIVLVSIRPDAGATPPDVFRAWFRS